MLSAEQITSNWEKFLFNLNINFTGDRYDKLFNFYDKFADRFALMPASGKLSYHNAFAGGYIDHVNRVLSYSLRIYQLWVDLEADVSTFTLEELAFVAINHDLGKFGDFGHEEYLIEEDNYCIKKGQIYKHNPDISFMKTSERSLFLLQEIGVPVSQNEYLGIKLHDGLYEEANKSYYMSFSEEYRLRSNLPYIVHQADLLATRVEHDRLVVKESPAKKAFRNSLKKELASKPSVTDDIKNHLPPPAPKPVNKNKYSSLLSSLK